ncbi:alanine racemase [Nocardia sp. NPDC127579]|uniref:alanine racemase n=1 Tax=Nocardia sp. NPDC127579 TaxID=3345402 RepID=UPI00363DCAFA
MELSTSPVRLPALEQPWQRQVRADPDFLFDIHHAVGGPFHVVHPEQFAANLRAFQNVLAAHRVPGRVYFGKKANKAGCWLDVAADLAGSVDVASTPELVHALAHGVRGADIGVTGAAKSPELLRLAARHDCVVAVDALDELERLAAIAARSGRVRILLRRLPPGAPHSRFGLADGELERAIQRCGELPEIELIGFSFHLDGYQARPRAELAHDLLRWCAAAKAQGHPISALSLGGGFACSYLGADDWSAFLARDHAELFHAGRRFERFYPYAQAPTGAAMLEAVLTTEFDGRPLAAHVRAAGVELFLEPGRALLIDAGFTVFPVLGFKRNADYGITTVQGLSMSVSEQWKGSEFLPDPILVPRRIDAGASPIAACVGGSSCMEYDMLTWRKVVFTQRPEFGDLLLYPNTAGYQMDKNESEFHQLPLPPKVVVDVNGGRPSWRLDR